MRHPHRPSEADHNVRSRRARLGGPLGRLTLLALGAGAAALAPAARAEGAPVGPEATASSTAALPASPPPLVPPPPYSLPWQLRPVAAGTVLRSDTSMALYEDPKTHNGGSAVATMLLGSYKVTPSFAPLVRFAFVQNDTPAPAAGGAKAAEGASFVNPIVGATYGQKLGAFRLAEFAGAAIPIGQGGGDKPDAGEAGANKVGAQARSAMDNAMFAVNYFTGIVGVDGAYVDHKVTVQAEATLFQLFRARGENNGAASNDATRTNSTFGLHVGYFVIPALSLGGELRYQRWLSTPTTKTTTTDPTTMTSKTVVASYTDAQLDTVSFGVGPRFHFKVGKSMWLRPGISYSRILDKPLSDSSFNMFQVDIPVVF